MSSVSKSADTSTGQRAQRISLRGVSLALVVIGLLITGYLTYTHLFQAEVICIEGGAFDCSKVTSGPWSMLMGIPVAYLGLGAWLTLGALVLLETRITLLRDYGSALVFGLALFGFLFHSYLTYTSVFVIQSLCPWCLAAHATMTLMLIVSGLRLYRNLTTDQA